MQHYKNVSAIKNPHDLLFQIGTKVATAITSREQSVALDETWTGIGFSLCGQKMVAQLCDISEILPMPTYTRIYGADPWLLGVTNVRGALVTLVDMETLCGSSLASSRQNLRVLIVRDGYTRIGLVVKNVFGQKNFNMTKFKPHALSEQEAFARYLDAQISVHEKKSGKEELWYRFSLEKLLGSEQIGGC